MTVARVACLRSILQVNVATRVARGFYGSENSKATSRFRQRRTHRRRVRRNLAASGLIGRLSPRDIRTDATRRSRGSEREKCDITHRSVGHASSRRRHRVRRGAIRRRRVPPRGKAARGGDRRPVEPLAPHHLVRRVHHLGNREVCPDLDPQQLSDQAASDGTTSNEIPAAIAAPFASGLRSHLYD